MDFHFLNSPHAAYIYVALSVYLSYVYIQKSPQNVIGYNGCANFFSRYSTRAATIFTALRSLPSVIVSYEYRITREAALDTTLLVVILTQEG